MNRKIPSLGLSRYITTSTEKEPIINGQQQPQNTSCLLPTPPTSPESIQNPHTLIVSSLSPTTMQSKRKKSVCEKDNEDNDRRKVHKSNTSSNKLDLHLLDQYLSSGKSINIKDGRYDLSLLCWACRVRSIEAVQKILLQQQQHIDMNQAHGPHKITALHIASVMNFTAGVDCLAQHPEVDLNRSDSLGQTPLHYATRSHSTEAVSALLEAGARLDIVDRQGKFPLHYAIANQSPTIIRLLLSRKERNNPTCANFIWSHHLFSRSAIEDAVIVSGYSRCTLDLIIGQEEGGAFVAIESGGWYSSAEHFTKYQDLLTLCVFWNRFECLKCLVEQQQQQKDTQFTKETLLNALDLAVQQRKLDIAKYLCQIAGADPCDNEGCNSSLLYAANHGFMDMVPFLLTFGTSEDCVKQAILFSKMNGKHKEFLELVKTYWK